MKRIELIHALVACAGVAMACTPPAVARPDTILGTARRTVSVTVPDPKDPNKTVTVSGKLVGRVGVTPPQNMDVTSVAGIDIAGAVPDGYELHFINLVTEDTNPPKWKDEEGNVHEIKPGEMYVDPLSGGNIPKNAEDPPLEADRDPAYDGETPDRKASTVGDFNNGEKKEYDLDDKAAYNGDPVLEKIFGDRPNLRTAGGALRFVTFAVLIKKPTETTPGQIYRMGGFGWGADANGTVSISPAFSGWDSVTTQQLRDALIRSGYANYEVAIPSPAGCALGAIAVTVIAWRRRR